MSVYRRVLGSIFGLNTQLGRSSRDLYAAVKKESIKLIGIYLKHFTKSSGDNFLAFLMLSNVAFEEVFFMIASSP
jgi:hypothetical protein